MAHIYAYPKEIEPYVRKWALKLRDRDLAVKVNKKFGTEFNEQKIKAYRNNHKIKTGMPRGRSSEEYWNTQKIYPKGMKKFIEENSWETPSAELADMVNKKYGTNFTGHWIKCFRQRMGIKSGLTGWFQRGRSPGNKGKKMPPEIVEKTRATQFKTGHIPMNLKEVGYTTVRSDGYVYIKVQNDGEYWDRWKLLHRFLWEQNYGPIPTDSIVTFKDNNPLNCVLDNLMLIKKAEHSTMVKKNLRSSNPELTEAAVNMIRLNRLIKEKRNEK